SSKAKAIQAVIKQGHTSILITDEGAAKQLTKGITL
ncbi:sugar-binding domain-containing protein, partial [Vibrio parahaemolyticus]|nr:sugar-binding domain-containing protein [Vibrio parahaemolyticus]